MDDETVTIAAALSTACSNLYADETTPTNSIVATYWRRWPGNEGGSNVNGEVSKVGRLGNENDLYGEFGFRKRGVCQDDVSFLVDSMLSYWQGQDENAADKSVDVVQLNVRTVLGLFEDKDIGILRLQVNVTTNVMMYTSLITTTGT